MHIALATCLQKPQLTSGDARLAAALQARGACVGAHPWNGPFDPFAAADLVVVRSTWDYMRFADAFAGWIGRLETQARRVANAPALMRWNLSKTYLIDLAEKGAPLPPTVIAEPDVRALADAVDRLGLDEAVVKPVIGGGAFGLSVVRRRDPASFAQAAGKLAGPALVQPLIPEICTAGETSLVFFAGAFSHAVEKRPKLGSILVQEEHGGSTVPARVGGEAVEAARCILKLLPQAPLYARVDVVLGDSARLDGGLKLMEVEVIEPSLFLEHDAAAADRFAEALLHELKV